MGWIIQGGMPDMENKYYYFPKFQTVSGHHPTYYLFDTGGSFSEGKAARV
jgi:hypothetical protein